LNIEDLKKSPYNLNEKDIEWVLTTWTSLTDEEKAGQMFIPLCMDLGKENMDRILDYKPGGVQRFASMPADALRNSAEYLQSKSRIPLLLTGDLEFGTLGTLGTEGTEFQTQIGTAASSEWKRDVESMARIAAREGGALGFNWSFSPVVDINYNFRSSISSTRSFGSNPEKVRAMGNIYIQALQDEGMAACAKHWPGDGIDERDQHMVTTHNTLSMEEWHKTYGSIYKTMIDSGVLSIMSAHLTLAAWDRELNPKAGAEEILPASISSNLNIKLLREKLGFNGVIISDATGMAGLTSQGTREKLVPMVINSGCDIFLFSVEDDHDFSLLIKFVKDGTIPEKRVEEAVLRILALKASLGLHVKQQEGTLIPDKKTADTILGCSEHKKWRDECVSSSITLVKDTQKLLPVSPETHRRVLLIQSTPVAFFGPPEELHFREFLEDAGFEVTMMAEDIFPSPDFFDLVIYLVNQTRFFGSGSYFADWQDLHKGLMKSMVRTWDNIPTMMISLSNPYHLFDAPRVKTYINAYSPIDAVQRELVSLITGKSPFKGTNPVDPFCGLEDAKL